MKRIARGFTLVEIMITVAIIGILTAVALPAYRSHVTKARLVDAFSGLASVPSAGTTFWDRKYTFDKFDRLPADTKNFTFKIDEATVNSLKVTATGIDQAAGFNYSIDQSGNRSSKTSWGNSDTCWVDTKEGKCTQ